MAVQIQDGGFVSAWRGGLTAFVQGELRAGTVSQKRPGCFLTIEGAMEVRLWGCPAPGRAQSMNFCSPFPSRAFF